MTTLDSVMQIRDTGLYHGVSESHFLCPILQRALLVPPSHYTLNSITFLRHLHSPTCKPHLPLTQAIGSFRAGRFEFAVCLSTALSSGTLCHSAMDLLQGTHTSNKTKAAVAQKAKSKKCSALRTASQASLTCIYVSTMSDCREPLVWSSSLCLRYSDLRVIGRESPFILELLPQTFSP